MDRLSGHSSCKYCERHWVGCWCHPADFPDTEKVVCLGDSYCDFYEELHA